MKVFIKSTWGNYSIPRVIELLKQEKIQPLSAEMGEYDLGDTVSPSQLEHLRQSLSAAGYELILNRNNIVIEKVHCLVHQLVYGDLEYPATKYSEFISRAVKINYTRLSKLFSRIKGITLEQFIILCKIERAKHLIAGTEYTLSEIAKILHYSSVSHLSAQFKKITGIPPSLFRRHRNNTGLA